MSESKNPPERSPTWATDGGALLTDPGATKQADGWLVDEAPSAHHFNWFTKEQGAAIDLLLQGMAPQLAWQNMKWGEYYHVTGFTPEGTQHNYDRLAQRWYSSAWHTAGTFAYVYHQAKNDPTAFFAWLSDNISPSVRPTAGSIVPCPVSNGTIIATIIDDYYYQSSNLSVSNFDSGTAGPATWADSRGFIYSDANSLWVAAVNDTTGDGEIWTAADDFSGGFTLRSTPDVTYGMNDIAVAGPELSDTMVAITDGPRCYSSTDGITWSQKTSNQITLGGESIQYCKGMLKFFSIEQTSGNVWMTQSGLGWTDLNADYGLPACDSIIVNDDMVLFFTKAATNYEVYAMSAINFHANGTLAEVMPIVKLGTISADVYRPRYDSAGCKVTGADAGHICYEYSVQGFQGGVACTRYKPQVLDGTISYP